VWLIENDVTSRGVAPSRLPVPVVFAHLGLAAGGLTLWVVFLIVQRQGFAWAAIGVLGAVAVLGLSMFARWIPVHRGNPAPAAPDGAAPGGAALGVPAEGNLPVVIVIAHGLLAVSTLVLALLTVLVSRVP
jgi:hypothetical protein